MDGLDFRVWSSRPSPDTDADAAGGGPTFVLIHGLGMSQRSQRRLHAALARGGAVHSIDPPGFGGTRTPRTNVPVERMADALGALIPALSAHPVVVSGHSMGAQWAVETALRHPAVVEALVLIAPVVDDHRRTLREQVGALAADGPVETVRANTRTVTDYLRTNLAWFSRQVRHMLAYDLGARVALLEVPVLLVRGSRDPVVGDARLARIARLAARATRTQTVVVSEHAHHVELTAPRVVADAIVYFCTRAADRAR